MYFLSQILFWSGPTKFLYVADHWLKGIKIIPIKSYCVWLPNTVSNNNRNTLWVYANDCNTLLSSLYILVQSPTNRLFTEIIISHYRLTRQEYKFYFLRVYFISFILSQNELYRTLFYSLLEWCSCRAMYVVSMRYIRIRKFVIVMSTHLVSHVRFFLWAYRLHRI